MLWRKESRPASLVTITTISVMPMMTSANSYEILEPASYCQSQLNSMRGNDCMCELTAKISYMELVRLLVAHEHDKVVAETVADYLTSCIDFELNLEGYLWNELLFNTAILDSKEEAIQYIKDNLCCDVDDCTIFEASNGKCYLEWR